MPYDLEKYRDKREKVLGVKKRGISFSAWTGLVSITLIIVMGALVVPKSIAYLTTRKLDDAIYKLVNEEIWPQDILYQIKSIDGVKFALTDKDGKRLIVTFDRSAADLHNFSTWFLKKGFQAILLNRANHRQRLSMEKEEAAFEAL